MTSGAHTQAPSAPTCCGPEPAVWKTSRGKGDLNTEGRSEEEASSTALKHSPGGFGLACIGCSPSLAA